jgi:hypothetical protein
MKSRSRTEGWWRSHWITAIVAACAFLSAFTVTQVWAKNAADVRIFVLGSGSQLSILVTAGEARLLIAAGDDTTAFGNALAQALPPTARRIDVLMWAGSGQSSIVSRHAEGRGARYLVDLNPVPAPSVARELDESETLDFSGTRRLELPKGVFVSVEVAPPSADDRDPQEIAWRITVERQATRVMILSDGAHARLFPPPGSISALIVATNDPEAAVSTNAAPVVIVNAVSVSQSELLQDMAPVTGDDQLILRVHPGQAQGLRFDDLGLQIPQDVVRINGERPQTSPYPE